jgi:phenylalanyl-tRNA synthetase alpha subunit
MQDTFYIFRNSGEDSNTDDILLRTHNSSVQVRVMHNQKPPIRTISPGRVFRNEAISARAHCIFHQIEGLYIDENVSLQTSSRHVVLCQGTLAKTRYVFALHIFPLQNLQRRWT